VPLKILHIYKDFDPPICGGIERHMALSCRFQRQWADVEALTCSRRLGTRRLIRDGTAVTEVGEWGRIQGAPFSVLFPLYLRGAQADVVVVHAPNPTAELSWLLARHQGLLAVRYHSDVIRQARAMRFYRPFQQRFLRRADLIMPTSEIYRDSSASLAPFRDKCRVVPLGIVPSDFLPPAPEAIAALKGRYGGPFVLFTGRHRYYKGLPGLIEAARSIDAPVVVSGDGPERLPVERLARSLGVRVHFPGHLDHADLVAHLHACELLVFPSVERSEAFGVSIMEAHCCGKPAVATALGTGVEFINQHGKTGLNVPPRDSGSLAAAVNRLLNDPAERIALGHYAAARIRNEFDAETLALREFELYREALARRR
jgi:glycosyltransferase involved in cell wall biosynthesis